MFGGSQSDLSLRRGGSKLTGQYTGCRLARQQLAAGVLCLDHVHLSALGESECPGRTKMDAVVKLMATGIGGTFRRLPTSDVDDGGARRD